MRTLTLSKFCLWLEDTDLSQAIQVSDVIVPLTQIIHIFAVAAALSACLLIALRLLGYFAIEFSLSHTFNKFWPIFKVSTVVLLLSGSILIIGEPSRSLENSVFQTKMLLLMCVFVNIQFIKKTFFGKLIDWKNPVELTNELTTTGKTLAVILISLLILIVFAGRWIAYT